MKYSCSCTIKAPINTVSKLFEDESLFHKWQDGFQSITLVKGEKNRTGAVSKIILQQGKMRIELTEEILKSNMPEEKIGLYVHKHMTNTQKSIFNDLGNGNTQYISEVEYTQFNGFLPRLMSWLFPGKFKAQSQKWMNQFKEMVESKEEHIN